MSTPPPQARTDAHALHAPPTGADMTCNDTTDRRAANGSAAFVPRADADPVAARYETMTPARAVDRIVEVGFTRPDAQQMVSGYLAEQTTRHGEPAGGWQVDPYDLAEIARAYEWVDHYRGETLGQARDRAAEYATGWRDRAAAQDRDADPHTAARIDHQVQQWTDRATHPATADATGAMPVMPQWMAEQARATETAIAAGTYQLPAADHPTRITARLAALRGDDDAAAEEQRRDQLTRWHGTPTHDDLTHGDIGDVETSDVVGDSAAGWPR